MEATEQPRAAPFRQFDSTVTAPKGVVLRAEAAKTSEKVGSLKASDAVSVLELARTASGTTRARVSSTTKQAPVGWVTATTSTGKQFLAMPRTVPEAAALPEAVPAQGPEPEPEPEPEPKPKPMPGPEKRAELRKRLAATPFLKHKHPQFMHGRAYEGPIAPTDAPRVTWRSAKAPRDDHDTAKWLTASEFADQPEAARLKCKQLATMMRLSRKTVVYSGAGISASVIGQAARSGQNKQGWMGNRHQAEPTFTHKALGYLVNEGLIHGWVQQNHDGLPQKAGVPQEKINEIHGSWYDPSNPVVKYHGDLHDDLEPWMVKDSETADLVIVLGTSLGGLYADQVATDTAERSRWDGDAAALGSVMINLQQTEQDGKMSLRLFGTSDDMLKLLLVELGYSASPRFQPPVFPKENRVLVPYDKNGDKVADGEKKMWLDLSPGAQVRITPGHNIQGAKQPAFLHIGGKKPRKYKGAQRLPGPGHGRVEQRNESKMAFELTIEGAKMRLGLWWLDAAIRGAVDKLPIANLKPEME